MSATFPENYPFAMAKFKFETPVYHPNVYKDGEHAGEICDKALGSDDWKPNSMTRNVIQLLAEMWNSPNTDEGALNAEAA